MPIYPNDPAFNGVSPTQLRRGSLEKVQNYVPAQGELVYSTNTNEVYVGDGSTVGGYPVINLDMGIITPAPAPAPPPGPGGWVPSNISGLILWLDAQDGTSFTLNGSNVSQWSDKSGQNNHFTQSTESYQPEKISSGIDSKASVSFDGDDEALLSPSGFLYNVNTFTHAMVFNVYNDDNAGIFAPSSTVLQGYELALNSAPLARFNSNQYNSIASFIDYDGTTVNLMCLSLSDSGYDVYNKGTLTNSNATPLGEALNFNGQYSLGQYYQPGFNCQGIFGEVVVYNRALTTEDRQKLEGYMAHRWGLAGNLPGDHPYKSSPPA